MKINPFLPVAAVEAHKASSRDGKAARSGLRGETVELSDTARSIQDLQAEAAELPDVREDEIARARADIASGRLGGDDLDDAVNAMLAGF